VSLIRRPQRLSSGLSRPGSRESRGRPAASSGRQTVAANRTPFDCARPAAHLCHRASLCDVYAFALKTLRILRAQLRPAPLLRDQITYLRILTAISSMILLGGPICRSGGGDKPAGEVVGEIMRDGQELITRKLMPFYAPPCNRTAGFAESAGVAGNPASGKAP
jgi:hypothetical protein